MKIIIKEMSVDRNKLLIYLMTNDNVPVKCEMTTRENSDEVIKNLTPKNLTPKNEGRISIIMKKFKEKLKDE